MSDNRLDKNLPVDPTVYSDSQYEDRQYQVHDTEKPGFAYENNYLNYNNAADRNSRYNKGCALGSCGLNGTNPFTANKNKNTPYATKQQWNSSAEYPKPNSTHTPPPHQIIPPAQHPTTVPKQSSGLSTRSQPNQDIPEHKPMPSSTATPSNAVTSEYSVEENKAGYPAWSGEEDNEMEDDMEEEMEEEIEGFKNSNDKDTHSNKTYGGKLNKTACCTAKDAKRQLKDMQKYINKVIETCEDEEEENSKSDTSITYSVPSTTAGPQCQTSPSIWHHTMDIFKMIERPLLYLLLLGAIVMLVKNASGSSKSGSTSSASRRY